MINSVQFLCVTETIFAHMTLFLLFLLAVIIGARQDYSTQTDLVVQLEKARDQRTVFIPTMSDFQRAQQHGYIKREIEAGC